MRPFSDRNYRTPVVHVARVVEREDGDEVETWPGAGTELLANVSQGDPQGRTTQSVEESLTRWVLWFSLAALVELGVTIRRGDRLTLSPAYGDDVVLRATAHGSDFNQLGVSVMVPAEQVV